MTTTAESPIAQTDDTGRDLRTLVALEVGVALRLHLANPYHVGAMDPAVLDALHTLASGHTTVTIEWQVWGRRKGDTGPMRRASAADITTERAARQRVDDLAWANWVYDVRPVLTLRITEDPA